MLTRLLWYHGVPTALPIGEYAAVALLAFFGFKSIKDALALPDTANGNLQGNSESGELAEAEELVKEKVVLVQKMIMLRIVFKNYNCFAFTLCTWKLVQVWTIPICDKLKYSKKSSQPFLWSLLKAILLCYRFLKSSPVLLKSFGSPSVLFSSL